MEPAFDIHQGPPPPEPDDSPQMSEEELIIMSEGGFTHAYLNGMEIQNLGRVRITFEVGEFPVVDMSFRVSESYGEIETLDLQHEIKKVKLAINPKGD